MHHGPRVFGRFFLQHGRCGRQQRRRRGDQWRPFAVVVAERDVRLCDVGSGHLEDGLWDWDFGGMDYGGAAAARGGIFAVRSEAP